jgi:hypothetical protein
MLRRAAHVRTDVSEESISFLFRLTRIGELGTTLSVASNQCMHTVFFHSVHPLLVTDKVPSSPILVTLMMEAIRSPETSVLTRATRRNISEDGILFSHRRENLKSYKQIYFSFQEVAVSQNLAQAHVIYLFMNTPVLVPGA